MEDADSDELGDICYEAREHEDEGPGGVGAYEHGLAAIGVGEVTPEGAGETHKKGKDTGRCACPESCIGCGVYAEFLLDEEGVERLHEGPADGCDPLGEANQGNLTFPVVQASEKKERDDGGFGDRAH